MDFKKEIYSFAGFYKNNLKISVNIDTHLYVSRHRNQKLGGLLTPLFAIGLGNFWNATPPFHRAPTKPALLSLSSRLRVPSPHFPSLLSSHEGSSGHLQPSTVQVNQPQHCIIFLGPLDHQPSPFLSPLFYSSRPVLSSPKPLLAQLPPTPGTVQLT